MPKPCATRASKEPRNRALSSCIPWPLSTRLPVDDSTCQRTGAKHGRGQNRLGGLLEDGRVSQFSFKIDRHVSESPAPLPNPLEYPEPPRPVPAAAAASASSAPTRHAHPPLTGCARLLRRDKNPSATPEMFWGTRTKYPLEAALHLAMGQNPVPPLNIIKSNH